MPTDPGVDPRLVWRQQPVEVSVPRVDELRARNHAFDRTIRRRNRLEYGAAILVVLVFGARALLTGHAVTRVGCLLAVAGTLFVVEVLRRRGSPGPEPPGEVGLQTGVARLRTELVRQRDLLRGVWAWYLAPLVPGLAVLIAGEIHLHPERAAFVGIYAACCTLLFAGIGWLNMRAAAELQREIEALEALS